MINYFYKSLEKDEIKRIDKFLSGSWVYVEGPNEEELEKLNKKFNLDIGLLKDALDPFEVPRVETDGSETYFFCRTPLIEEGILSTTPILFVINKKFLITVANKNLAIFEKYFNNRLDFTTKNGFNLFLQIFGEINNLYNSSLIAISRRISQASSNIEKIENKDIAQFVNYEQITNEYLSRLIQNNSVLNKIVIDRSFKLSELNKELLDDLVLANGQLIELSKNSLQNVKNIRDSYSTILSNNLNRVIKLLTSLTIILNVPTMIAGLWGMNVVLPFAHSIYSFVFVLLIIVIICFILIRVFRRKDWI